MGSSARFQGLAISRLRLPIAKLVPQADAQIAMEFGVPRLEACGDPVCLLGVRVLALGTEAMAQVRPEGGHRSPQFDGLFEALLSLRVASEPVEQSAEMEVPFGLLGACMTTARKQASAPLNSPRPSSMSPNCRWLTASLASSSTPWRKASSASACLFWLRQALPRLPRRLPVGRNVAAMRE